jgi:hypothetical protein
MIELLSLGHPLVKTQASVLGDFSTCFGYGWMESNWMAVMSFICLTAVLSYVNYGLMVLRWMRVCPWTAA